MEFCLALVAATLLGRLFSLKNAPRFPILPSPGHGSHFAVTLGLWAFAILLLPVFLTSPASAAAGINQQINFQGRLLNSAGAVVPDGNYNIEFKIYSGGPGNVAGDTGGTLQWTEDWIYGTGSPDNRVVVRNGYFSINLGSLTSLSTVDFNSDTLWLSMNIGNTTTAASFAAAGGDGEMLPMKRLTSSPYAFNSAKLGGLAASAFGQLSANNTFTGTNLFQPSASASALQVSNATGAVLTVDTSGNNVIIGKAGSVTGTLQFANATGANVVGIQASPSSAAYTVKLPTAAPALGQCLQNDNTTVGQLVWNSCGGGSVTLQQAYNASTSPELVLNATNGALTVRDASTSLGAAANLLEVQNNAGTITYFGVTPSGINVQDANGAALAFDNTTNTLKVYENVASPTNFASISYSSGAAIFAASSGTTQIGSGSGNVSGNLTGATDVYTFGTTLTAGAAYSQSNFSVQRTVAGGANALGGALLKVLDSSTANAGVTINPTLLLINQAATGGTVSGNLIDAQLAGTSKFSVTTAGNLTTAGSLTVAGLSNCTALQTSGAGLFSCASSSAFITALGAIDGSGSPNANGATVTAGTFYLNSASASFGGVVNTTTQTFAGTKTFNGGLVVAASQTVTLTGSGTRPGSPTAGMLYYDTSTNQLIQYNGTKWVSDKSPAIIVAASNSSQTAKDAADYVATGTGDQATINSALTAVAGGTVYLMAGTYNLTAAISIPNNTTLAGAGAGSIITIPNAQNGSYKMVTNTDVTTGTHVTIRDLLINGNSANQTSGTMYGIYLDHMGGGNGSGSRDGAKVTNVIIRAIRGNGFYFATSNNSTLNGNTVQGGTSWAIIFDGSSYNTAAGNLVQGNGCYGFLVNNTANYNTISGNTIESNACGGVFIQNTSAGTTVTGNTILSNSTYGVYVAGSGVYATVSGNMIQNNSYGVYLGSGEASSTVTGNTIKQNSTAGVYLTNSTNNTVSGNNIDDNGGATTNNGISFDPSFGSSNSTVTGNTITDTSCTSNCYAINIQGASSSKNYLADNTLGTNGSINDLGTGTIYANQSDAAGNFTFKPTSNGGITVQNAFNPSAGGTQTGTSISVTNTPTSVANTAIGEKITITDATALANTIQGLVVDTSGITNASATVNTAIFKTKASAAAFQVQNSSGNSILGVDSSAGRVLIGTASSVQGNLVISGATSGSITVTTAAAAGTYTLTLANSGATGNQCLQSTSGSTSSATTLQWGSCGTGGGASSHSKVILLTPEYAGAMFDSANDATCSSANSGSMNPALDLTNRMNYYDWSSTSTTNQCFDIVVQVPVPSDWQSWAATPVSLQAKTDDTLNSALNIEIRDSTGAVETNFNYASSTLSTSWANVAPASALGGTYSAGGYMTVRIRATAKNSKNLMIGNLQLSYTSAY